MSAPDLAILIVAANRCVADRLGAAVATAGGESMRPSFGFVIRAVAAEQPTVSRLAELLGVLMLTSKGAAAVTGGGFITLAATLSALHTLPVAALALLLGVDRFMSEARALTNMVGNVVATLVVARWEGHLDVERARAVLGACRIIEVW